MSLFKKDWSPEEADEWTVHDLVASVLSALSYILVMVGIAGALLLKLWGFIALGIGIICTILTYVVIDPKLRAMSAAFDKRQDEVLEQVEKTTRWEK
ncbi:MAG: hypothetical protein JW860_10575 [Sedimentisphaerales bacterium]|nr:hypothetical protein [Sedimentisphaerales bacterium]